MSRIPTKCAARRAAELASGGKVVKVDRVGGCICLNTPPPPQRLATANRLGEAPPLDLVPLLSANPDVTVEKTTRSQHDDARFNHLHPPSTM